MTPVLGAKIGGIPELIDDCKTGILFENGNLKKLTGEVNSCITTKNFADK